MANNIFPRDWVFNVVEPFLRRLKNRLANIKIEGNDTGIKFYDAENVSTQIDIPTLYNANGILSENREVGIEDKKLSITGTDGDVIEFEIETYGNESYPVIRAIGNSSYGGGFAVGAGNSKNAVWYGTGSGFGVWSYKKNKDVLTYNGTTDLFWLKSPTRVGSKLYDGSNKAGDDGSVLTSTGSKTKWANPALDFANKIKIISYEDIKKYPEDDSNNEKLSSAEEVTAENLLAHITKLNNTDDYLNSFITIQRVPIAENNPNGNMYEGKPLFFFKKTGNNYEILEVYKKQTREDLGFIQYSANIKSDNYKEKMLFFKNDETDNLDVIPTNIEVIENSDGYMGFKVNRDAFITINITEGFYLKNKGRYVGIAIEPENGITKDDYKATFGVKWNRQYDLFTRFIKAPVDNWFSEEIEFRTFVKANKGFLFKISFYDKDFNLIENLNDSGIIGLDGGSFSRIDIRGV
jgi:hypothetical protein